MLIGFNNDVEYRGKTFHIQTEDHGVDDPRIETQLFHSGAILDTKITSYDDILEEYEGEEAQERVKATMKANHKALFNNLKAGEYDELAGLDPISDPEEVEGTAPDDFTPSQDRVPAAAKQVEEEGPDAIQSFSQDQAKQHVDLDTLKGQLGDMDGEEGEQGDEVSEVDDVAPTQVVSPPSSVVEETSSVSTAGASASAPQPSASQKDDAALMVDDALAAAKGVPAWTGCGPLTESFDVAELVEEFVSG